MKGNIYLSFRAFYRDKILIKNSTSRLLIVIPENTGIQKSTMLYIWFYHSKLFTTLLKLGKELVSRPNLREVGRTSLCGRKSK